jgi:hypothetical protein
MCVASRPVLASRIASLGGRWWAKRRRRWKSEWQGRMSRPVCGGTWRVRSSLVGMCSIVFGGFRRSCLVGPPGFSMGGLKGAYEGGFLDFLVGPVLGLV